MTTLRQVRPRARRRSGGEEAGSESGEAPTDGGESDGSSDDDDGDESGGSDLTGEELYLAMCSGCHGAEGEGTMLGYELQHHDPEHFKWVVRNGRPGEEFESSVMLAYDETMLSDAVLDEMLVYLDSFPQPTTSDGLYADYCGNCHGADGSGGTVDKDITDKGFDDTEEKVREGIGLDAPGERAFYMPMFDAERLTDDELQLIVDFFDG